MEQEVERALRHPKTGVRCGLEGAVSEEGAEGQEVELRGVLETISNRFYRGGWGYGTLVTDHGRTVKITGALEGHVAGTSLIVRGQYKESAYGLQLDCSGIVVDSVSGELAVIAAWARKHMKEHKEEVLRVVRPKPPADRWPFLCEAKNLIQGGFSEELATKVARAAKFYLLLIETKKGLMEHGFTDHEAEEMCATYGDKVEQVLETDPFDMVLRGIITFNRMDAVDDGRTARNGSRRLQAAVVQALASAQRQGHTAVYPKGVYKEAADMAGVYPEAIVHAGLPQQAVMYNGRLQLRRVAWAEQDIAVWVLEAMRRA